ncbi:MAG: carbohydrate ABC transporter permease, partial [Thermomicrobiales bacterium]
RHRAGQMAVKVAAQHRTMRTSSLKWRRHLEGWLFIGPVILGILAFQFVPILVSLYASLTRWDGLRSPEFIGIDNYTKLVADDPHFRTTMRNTLFFVAGHIPLTILVALGLALLCNRQMRGISFFRTTYFIPAISNVVAVSVVWFWIYRPENGALNDLLSVVGIEGHAWLSELRYAMPAVILVSVWQGVGYPMVILLAGLQGIPEDLYDAAKVDGSRSWNRFRDVTLPLLTPTLFFLLITQFISSFQVFGIIYVMTQGGPANATSVYIYYLYENAFSFGRMGYASAMAWVLFAMIAAITFVQWKLQKRWVFYG